MATIRELRARFTADAQSLKGIFRDMQTGLRDVSRTSNQTTQSVNRDFSSMQNTMSDVERALNDVGDVNGFGELRQSIEQAQNSLSETGQIGEAQMQEIRRAIDRARDNFENLGSDGRQSLVVLGQSINRLDSDIRDLGGNSNLDELRNDLSDVNDELRETSDEAENASESTGKIGSDNNRKGIGGMVEGVGKLRLGAVALVGAFATAGVAVVGFLAQNDKLQKAYNTLQTQTGATKEEMEGMEESLKNIYRNNYGESFEDIALSMANVKQVTGLAGDELENMTTKAFLLRDTFGYEVEESVKAADTVMKNFGITADEAYTLIAQGAQQGADKGGKLQFAA